MEAESSRGQERAVANAKQSLHYRWGGVRSHSDCSSGWQRNGLVHPCADDMIWRSSWREFALGDVTSGREERHWMRWLRKQGRPCDMRRTQSLRAEHLFSVGAHVAGQVRNSIA